ncbi:autoinducer binding domain-containing protein [Devosia sp.]|uniref:autoinducer binding domain-containing protein n=1 Tax=Devosia sp. TaxID=1871048 RepID=UPI001AC9FA7C|nr:autoinducer binding domain-containing protein [Devosia sp.]MBN9310970.1 autoinducer binding domain-containing protein [Devosia sp.]
MNPRLLKLIDTLSLPLDENAARRALRHFALEANFDFFAYLYLGGTESFAVSNYPTEWQLLYVEKDYIRVDPVVTMAKHGPSIFTWSAASGAVKGARKDIRQFYADAVQFGISSGLSISVPVGFKNRMVFTLASKQLVPADLEAVDPVTAAVAVAFVHSRLGRGGNDVSLSQNIRLSPREAECLRWFSEGMSMPDIADTLGIGFRSVRSYLDAATAKLEAANTRQAATIATRLGLI